MAAFNLVDHDWDKALDECVSFDHSSIRVVCPFIKCRAAHRLLKYGPPGKIQIITRFNLGDFGAGVSDVSALKMFLDNGAEVRGVRNLHAKLYLFGQSRAVVTSANLTEAGLTRNHELGFVARDAEIVGACHTYFDDLWRRAGENLTIERLEHWSDMVTRHLVSGASPMTSAGLGDEGIDAGLVPDIVPVVMNPAFNESRQAFVKFFGEGANRVSMKMSVLDELEQSGAHWACTYPRGKRPRQVQDGDTLYIGRLVHPNDTVIFGRAIGMRHEEGRDDATERDIVKRNWKAKWPHYIRVHNGEFVKGTLENGISLNALMDSLEANAFEVTARHAAEKRGNTNPRRAYRQQAAVQLSAAGAGWLNERLEAAFSKCGKLTPAELKTLDWPGN